MILKTVYERNQTLKYYLETYPYKMCDLDFAVILDTAIDNSINYITSIKYVPDSEGNDVLTSFAQGKNIYITDVYGHEHVINKDSLLVGINYIINKDKDNLYLYGDEIVAPTFSSIQCQTILLITLDRNYIVIK